MKQNEVKIRGQYTAKVSGTLTTVEILSETRGRNGRTNWIAKNLTTGRQTIIKSAARLRGEVK